MFNYKDKVKNLKVLNNYMLAKTLSMFEWENLPETIPYKELEKILQVNGYAFITEVNGELYALSGSLGGEVDAYGNPTEIIINNVGLKFNATLNIKNDGVLIHNDDMNMGLIPLLERYNTFLVENDINMMMYGYNSRTQKLISASNDKTKASAELVVRKSIDGEIAVIGESVIFEGVKVHSGNSNNGQSITSLTEFHQYIKGSLYNELGLSANINMKRERLTAGETEVGDDSNYPFIFNMLKCRMKAVELINAKYSTDINIDFGSVWAKTSKEVVDDKLPLENDQNQNPNPDPDPNPNPDNNPDPNADNKAELQSIIDSETATDEDKETAKQLLAELEDSEND